MDPSRQRITDSTACAICSRADGEETMLLCDTCNTGYHMECLTPKVTEVPAGRWHCPQCIQGVSTGAALRAS